MKKVLVSLITLGLMACSGQDTTGLFGSGGDAGRGGGGMSSTVSSATSSSISSSTNSSVTSASSSGGACDPDVACSCDKLGKLLEFQAGKIPMAQVTACGTVDANALDSCCTGVYAVVDCGTCMLPNQACGLFAWDDQDGIQGVSHVCGGGCAPSFKYANICANQGPMTHAIICINGDLISNPPSSNCIASNTTIDSRIKVWCC